MANYYGTYNRVYRLFDFKLPSPDWTETVVTNEVLPDIYHLINSEMAAYFEVPFDNTTKHVLGVPPYIHMLAGKAAKQYILEAAFQDKKPNKSVSSVSWEKKLREELQRFKLADKKDFQELLYSDGTVVARKTTKPIDPSTRAEVGLQVSWSEFDDDGVDQNTYAEYDIT